MANRTAFGGENPFNVDPEADLLHQPDLTVEGWSENMFFQFGDPVSGISVRTHCGTHHGDSELWRGLFILFLNEDELLVSRSFGRADDNRGPNAGNIRFRCTELHRRWQLVFDGATERVTTLDAAGRLVGSGPTEPLKLELEFEAMAPVFDLFGALKAGPTEWAKFHHQQAFRASGAVMIGGQAIPLSGFGYRDHSVGGRNLKDFGGDHFAHASFESGRVVMANEGIKRLSGELTTQIGYLWEDHFMTVLGVRELPTLRTTDGEPSSFALGLELNGEEIRLKGQTLHAATMTICDPHDRSLGVNVRQNDPLVIVECPISLDWTDGETGYGMLERNQRMTTVELRGG